VAVLLCIVAVNLLALVLVLSWFAVVLWKNWAVAVLLCIVAVAWKS